MSDEPYIKFVLNKRPKDAKTDSWQMVSNNASAVPLGRIQWFGRFRKYCFFTHEETVFDDNCLDEVMAFLHSENNKHKQQLRKAKSAAQEKISK